MSTPAKKKHPHHVHHEIISARHHHHTEITKKEKPSVAENINEPLYLHEVKVLLEWSAPGRPHRTRSKEYYINTLLIAAAVLIIIFLIFKDFLLMVVVISFVFFAFALAYVPPHSLSYKISTEGIRIEDHFFIWDELYDFYFMKHQGQEMLHVRTKAFFPGELTMTLGDMPVEDIKRVLVLFLPFREYVKPSFMERAGDWLEKNFPLEKSSR